MNFDNHMSLIVGLLFFLLILSAFFSGSETALTRARRVRLRILRKSGNLGARYAERLLKKPERMLASILLGNNFVNIAASSLATALFVAEYGEKGILYATVVMTVVVLIFAEVLPKALAVAHSEKIACRVAIPMTWLQTIFSPIVAILMLIIKVLQKILNIKAHQEMGFSHQELAAMIDMSAESGVLDKAREQMLMSALHLHDVPIKSLMTPRKDMVMLNASHNLEDELSRAIRKPHSRYPVYHGDTDNILGIVHLRDLLKNKQVHKPLAQTMIWETPPYVPANRNALQQLFDFQSKHQHMAIVVDEFGDIEGIITLEDIIEEIVGEIVDEFDVHVPLEVWPQPDGTWVVGSTANLHDLNQMLASNLPESDATTIGGFVVHELGGMPEGLACLQSEHIQIEILQMEGERIQRLKIVRLATDDSQIHT